ncbi:MAG: glucosaminidase domain-containing protein [Puniceicoccales bacterium]|jgi:hypothetical protein|nr:glucosaminidase domain-containing protein [Puniceicoccales bacterium]
MKITVRTYLESILVSVILGGIIVFAITRLLQQKNTVIPNNTVILNSIPDYLHLLHRPKISEQRAAYFLIKNNPELSQEYVENIVRIYFKECQKESINVAAAIAQMALETGFLNFRGAIQKHQNNFAGMGSLHATHCGLSFSTVEEGIRAHIQHLKAYASDEPLRSPCVDPRREFIQRSSHFGKVKTVYDLCGAWATDEDYGKKLAKMIQNLLDFEVHN